jgi:hypothetical protein
MRKLNLTLLGLVALLAVAMVAVPAFSRLNDGSRIRPQGVTSRIYLTKTYDVYYVDCDVDDCVQSKCLYAADLACTRLTLCGVTFDQDFTDYDVYLRYWDGSKWVWIPVGSKGIETVIDKLANSLGRVRYELRFDTTNPGRNQSGLTGVTLCLGATWGDLIGSEYEQEHFDPAVGHLGKAILPEPGNEDVGANVILCDPPDCGAAIGPDPVE